MPTGIVFTDRETISYAEFIRRLPNCPTFAEVLLEIPHKIVADSRYVA